MPVSYLKNWNGKEVAAIQTRGGVWAFPNFLDGVICPDGCVCPAPELVQKLSRSDKYIHFHPEDQPAITKNLGYYTDLQSAHSEDAMVWSFFGTLAYSAPDARAIWTSWLGQKLGCDPNVNHSAISLWRRVPHPDNFTQGGPELDALIQTDKFVVIGEAKWRSSESRWQGIDGRAGQFDLREKFIQDLGKSLYPDRELVLLSIVLQESGDMRPTREGIVFRTTTWKTLVHESPHPASAELRRYYDWKRDLIPRKYGAEPLG